MPGRQSWVQSCAATGVYSHEFGHNLSLHHAGTPSAEYGDGSDPMGGAKTVLHNAANRVMAGWMAPGTVVDVWYHPDINEWMGRRSVEGKLLHLVVT